jgi:hypothetical protein
MGKAKSVTVDRVSNGFLARWTPTPSPAGPDPEERVHICADLEIALQMITDEISYYGEEMDVSLKPRPEQGD